MGLSYTIQLETHYIFREILIGLSYMILKFYMGVGDFLLINALNDVY